MDCVFCEEGKAVAKHTYYFAGTVYRSRLCSRCGKRFATYEEVITKETDYALFREAGAVRRALTRERRKNANKRCSEKRRSSIHGQSSKS